MFKLFSAALLFILTASIAAAHGSIFFEFAPDISNSLDLSLVATPSQHFRPPNDFLRGFDLWIANAGAAGSVAFGLRDANDTLLTSTTATIPTLAPVYGGTRFHIDFPVQVPIQSNQLYKIRIVNSLPGLKLYKASLLQLLPHTTQNYPEYVVEPAYLGTAEQDFAFKFAFYEIQETAPPIISNVAATIVGLNSVRIDFNANEPVDARADYGPIGQGLTQSTFFTGDYTPCPEGITFCSITLTVNPNTAYYYNLLVKDVWGNQTNQTGTFASAYVPTTPIPSPPGNPPASPGGSPTASPPPGTATPSPSETPPGSVSPSPSLSPLLAPPSPPAQGAPPSPSSSPPLEPPGGGSPLDTPPGPNAGSGAPTPGTNEGQPPITVSVLGGGDSNQPATSSFSILIKWNPPPELLANQGYLIEVTDEKQKLTRRIMTGGNTREIKVDRLAEGVYLVTIYANNDGILAKLGEYTITLGSYKSPRIFSPLKIAIAAVISVATASGLVVFLRKKRKFKPAI